MTPSHNQDPTTANSELRELLDVLDGPPGWKADLEALLAQAVAEARLDEHKILDKYLGVERDTERGKRRIIFVEDIAVRANTIEAQLNPQKPGEEEV